MYHQALTPTQCNPAQRAHVLMLRKAVQIAKAYTYHALLLSLVSAVRLHLPQLSAAHLAHVRYPYCQSVLQDVHVIGQSAVCRYL